MYWRGLPAQKKVKYSLLLVNFYTVLVLSRAERDCDLLVTLAKCQALGFDYE